MSGASHELTWLACRARLKPRATLSLHGEAALVVRGALGMQLDEEILRPRATSGPSGLRTAPAPFVLRTRALDNATIERGAEFAVEFRLFAPALAGAFERAFIAMTEAGVTRDRVKLDWLGLESVAMTADLTRREAYRRVRLEFVTPMELKGWSARDEAPPFEVLIRRIRDRVSALQLCHGAGALELDYRGLAERAAQVACVESRVTHVARQRTSSRTHETHPLSGMVGTASYAGALDEFMPLLRVAEHTGVGRYTVWGHGEVRVAECSPTA